MGVPLKKNEWKVSDIAGSSVFDSDGTLLGKLADVLPSGGNDIWVVKADGPSGTELMIPALRDVVREVDVEGKRITVSLPPGLKEIYEPPA